MWLESALLLTALVAAFACRPWQLLGHGHTLLTPLLATLVLLPWVWALPSLHAMPLQLPWSGACLVMLMLGWPLAVPVLIFVAVLAVLLSPLSLGAAIGLAVWQGVVPATLALALGWSIRRLLGEHLFVYLLGRTFIGTVLCVFAGAALSDAFGHTLPPTISGELSLVARWLMAWGDAFVTGTLCTMMVAFRPQWLATWSDRLYLKTPINKT
ncbi:MAG: hypothetical protein ABI212_07515 [Burkholderiaceae bacterium]